MIERDGCRVVRERPVSWRSGTWWYLAAIAVLLELPEIGGSRGEAQDQVRNFTQPILRHGRDGHYAPVRELIFARADGSQLLSGGMDKLIHLWSLGPGSRTPSRTFRPPIWRGSRGAIHCMAMAPRADARGQRMLAVAGYGVEAFGGNISLFRFPGQDLAAQATGEIVGHLYSAAAGAPPGGHSDLVFRLRFDPTGAQLASAGNDSNVLIWNVEERRVVAAFGGHAKPVRGLAYLDGGQDVVTGDSLGVVRVWNIAQPARPGLTLQTQPQQTPSGHAITALDVSPDGRLIVVGREDARLIRLDAATLQQAVSLGMAPTQAAVRALAVSHDGKLLATAIESQRIQTLADRPRLDCDVELRSFPDGQVLSLLHRANDQVNCCTFSPDDRLLAFAGDDRQTIRVQDLRSREQPPVLLQGPGAGIGDIGFRRDGLAIGFSRRPFGPANTLYEGFDLKTLHLTTIPAAELDRAVDTLDGWTIQPATPQTLRVSNTRGESIEIALDPERDVRWWSYTMLRPRKAGQRPLVAIGCESGIAIHSLDQRGKRTRFLYGHEGAVRTLAASRDGKWLATGAVDQTVRLWNLDGAESVTRFGAGFRRAANGEYVVETIAPRSFAEDMGLRQGDVLEICGFKDRRVPPGDFVAEVDTVEPGVKISIQTRERPDAQGKGPFQAESTKRHSPAASLFASAPPVAEWVLWTPQGYYDTSIEGDGKYLGWHLNQSLSDQPRPTVYYPIKQFQERLYHKDILKRLLESADVNSALGTAAPDPAETIAGDRPPALSVEVAEHRNDRAALHILAEGLPGRELRATQVRSGPRLVRTIDHEPGTTRFEQLLPIVLDSGRNRWNITTIDRDDRSQTRSVELDSEGTPDHPPRLVVMTLGAETFQVAGAILHADRDARDLASFFEARLVAPGSGQRFARDQIEKHVLCGPEARVDRLLGTLGAIGERCRRDQLGRDDLIVAVLESHFGTQGGRGVLLAVDTANGPPPGPLIMADDLGAALGEIAASGCKVVLLLDIVHDVPDEKAADSLKAWVRALRDRHGVITFLASRTRPSEPILVNGQPSFPRFRHRLFAQSVLDSIDTSRQTRGRINKQGCYSLNGFQEAVREIVRELTQDQMDSACTIPELIPEGFSLLDARAR